MKKSLLFLASLCLALTINAQSGWDLIKQNQNIEAKKVFLNDIKKDSLNEDALKGLIYLCSVDKDDYELHTYCWRLIRKNKTSAYYYIFDKWLDLNSEEDDASLPENLKTDKRLNEASDKLYNRKFDESKSIYASTISNLKWSMIGPFENVNGYGYEKQYPVEQNNFEYDLSKMYLNHNKIDLKWIRPTYTNQQGIIDFNEHCIRDNDGVYYANTFIEIKEEQTIQVRISRSYPIKLFIDDQLVFAQQDEISYCRDAEVLKVKLSAGWHRVLVKYNIGNFFSGKNGGTYGMYGDYDEYDDYSTSFNSFGANSLYGLFGRGGGQELTLRFTNEKNEILPLISSWDLQNYKKEKLNYSVDEKAELSYFKELIDKNPEDWFNYFLYYKAAIKSGYSDDIEEFALKTLEKHAEKVYFKFITYEVFNENGKKEKADKIISGIDQEKCPVYQLMYDELKQIDQKNEPEAYQAKIEAMRKISPSNLTLMKRLLNHYEKQGKSTEKKNLAKDLIKQYPHYEYLLDEFLEDDNKPKDYDIGNRNDYNAKKAEKEAAKRIKKYYSTYDYETLIKKYKGLNQSSNALALYDEIIKIEPNNFENRKAKAEYLFNLEQYDEAIKELENILTSQPYNGSVYELLGDICKDKKDDQNALKFYKLAKKYESAGGGYSLFGFNFGGGGEGIDEKIDKIQGLKQLKAKFNSKTLDEIINDQSGLDKYATEESVILGFVYDIIVEEEGTANLFSKMAIKILTDAGTKTWTEFDFSFLGNLTTCKVIKANGTEFNPDKSGGFVVFKNLEPGDIIKLEGNYKWNISTELGKELIQFNYLNFHVPMRYAKYEYGIAENLDFNYLLHNAEDKMQKRNADGFNFYRFEYSDLKKVVQEDAVVDQTDTYSSIMVSTMKDWSPVVEWFKAKSYRKLESNYELKAVRDSIIKPGMTDEQKVIAIYNYITKEIKYSYTRLLQSNYIPKNTDLTISSKIGDCKDVASLMIALLRMEGIESYYCLVKTNQFFHMKILPSLYFDHVIAAYVLNGKMNFVDLTTDFYPYYVLNENDVNAWGLLVKDGEKELFQLPNDHLDPNKNLTVHEIKATLNKDKSVDITVNSTYNGLNGGLLRELNAMKSKDQFEQDVLYHLGDGQFDNFSLEEYNFENMQEITTPLKGVSKFKAMNFSDNIVDIYFTRIPFMQGMKTTNIFSSNKRFNTIQLSQICRVTPILQKVQLDFPAGTQVRKMPKDISVENEFVKYYIKFTKTKTGIYAERYQEFKTNEIKTADFKRFRELYLQLLDYDRTKIGLIVNQ